MCTIKYYKLLCLAQVSHTNQRALDIEAFIQWFLIASHCVKSSLINAVAHADSVSLKSALHRAEFNQQAYYNQNQIQMKYY